MKEGERVVKSIKDRGGNNYTKTGNGGKARMQAAVNYMDEREATQLYTLENGQLVETDRHSAAARIEDTQTEYQQHLVFTTKLQAGDTLVNERSAAEFVARSIQERRPDADIYALAVHSDGKGEEKGVHVHAIVGTMTALRQGKDRQGNIGDLQHFRQQSYSLERHLEREQTLELTTPEQAWIRERQQSREQERTTQAHRERGQELSR